MKSAEALIPYWPRSGHGKAIATTLDPSLPFKLASGSLEVPPFDIQTGSEFLKFLSLSGNERDLDAESRAALALSQHAYGHTLALSRMAVLIQERALSIKEFANMYSNHSKDLLLKMWESVSFPDDDFPLDNLEDKSELLLGVMSFLAPDAIPQQLFESKNHKHIPVESWLNFNELR